MSYKRGIEIELDECGFHAIIFDVDDDNVLFVSDSYSRVEDAERAARTWIDREQRRAS